MTLFLNWHLLEPRALQSRKAYLTYEGGERVLTDAIGRTFVQTNQSIQGVYFKQIKTPLAYIDAERQASERVGGLSLLRRLYRSLGVQS